MPDVWLILDVSNLAWRAHHAVGRLSHAAKNTEVLFGVLRDVLVLQKVHVTNRVAFCFDRGPSLRRKLLPAYKSNREPRPERKDVRAQISRLRREILPLIGFRNVFSQPGYEADDLVASAVAAVPRPGRSIVVSGDKDLLQLLSDRVCVWNVQKKATFTKADLREAFGVSPKEWVAVKAIAGCSTDCVPGVDGVGEKTAARWLRGELNPETATAAAIYRWHENGLTAARKLVKLPFPGLRPVRLRDDEVTDGGGRRALRLHGSKSLNVGG